MIHEKPQLILEPNPNVVIKKINQDTINKIDEFLKKANLAFKQCNYPKSQEYLRNVELLCLGVYNPTEGLSNAIIILNLARLYLLKATLYKHQNYLNEAAASIEVSSSYLVKLSQYNESAVLQRLKGGLTEIDTDIQFKRLPRTLETITQAHESYKKAEICFLYAQDLEGLQRINLKIAKLGKIKESLRPY